MKRPLLLLFIVALSYCVAEARFVAFSKNDGFHASASAALPSAPPHTGPARKRGVGWDLNAAQVEALHGITWW